MKNIFVDGFISILIFILLTPIQVQSAESLLVDKKAAPYIIGELSGERAMDYIHKISRFHRIRGGGPGSGYNQAVDFVVTELKQMGIKGIKVDRFPSNGFISYLGWRSPVGWRVKWAKLWLIKPKWELLADFSHQAVSLMPYSNRASDQAEVVYVGEGKSDQDYEGVEVKGKIVFAIGGNGAVVHKKAVLERKALGVVVGPSHREDRLQYADLVEMSRLSPSGKERQNTRWGFSLSRRQTRELLKLVRGNQTLVMKAEVEAELFDGEMPVISATLPGKEFLSQEIILMGHLDHYKPGANDNASGSAGLLEIIRTLKTLIKEEKLQPPKRTLRFLWLPELHGAMAYVSKYKNIGQGALAGINLDMIGENYEKCRSLLYTTSPPFSGPGFVGVLMEDALSWVDQLGLHSQRGSLGEMNFRIYDYFGGSDHHVFCDSSIGVPSIMVGHSDVFHHSSYDTPDKCDPTELKRVMAAVTMASWVMANADDLWVKSIAASVHQKWLNRLHARTTVSLEMMNKEFEKPDISKVSSYLLRKILDYSKVIARVEKKALKQVKKLSSRKEVHDFIDELFRLTGGHLGLDNDNLTNYFQVLCNKNQIALSKPALTALEQQAKAMIPKRMQRGPLPHRFLQEKLGEDYSWYQKNQDKIGGMLGNKLYEVLNLCDGSHHALYIRDLISVEFSETDVQFVIHLLKDLKKLGIVKF
jgi:aminopeptidase-like protein